MQRLFCMLHRLSVFILVVVAFSEVVWGGNENERVISALRLGPNQHQLVEGPHPNAVVTGKFIDDISTSGWSYLTITDERVVGHGVPDAAAAYLAGWVELNLTASLVEKQWKNTMGSYCSQKPSVCKAVDSFLRNNTQFVKRSLDLSSPIWYQLTLIERQLEGMADAYSELKRDVLPSYALQYFQLHGEIDDLESALSPSPNSSATHSNSELGSVASSSERVLGSGSCSAIVKVLPGNSDLLVGHDTWTSFANMLRVFKHYDLRYQVSAKDASIVPGHTLTFPSYPGRLYSGDDYYLMSSGLLSMETSLEIADSSRWSYVSPECILENRRVMVANRLASSSLEWTQTFSSWNSGTYNNQWMIVDYQLFEPGAKDLKDGLLRVLEQIPGLIRQADLTSALRQKSYWASYNIPFFEEIFSLSGNALLVKDYGDWYTWDKAPRAKIFARDHSKVVDVPSFIRLMKYNDFQHDNLSRCNCTPPYSGENAIAARSDLNPTSGTYPFPALGHRLHGAIDMKVTSWSMFQKSECIAYSGPTFQQQPAFQWSTSNGFVPSGHPDLWHFDDVVVKWDMD